MSPRDLLQAFETIGDAPEGIKRLRELVLQLAVRGRLVTQDPEDEPASELLKEIEQEKAELIRTKKIRKPKPLSAISPAELPSAIPSGWAAARLGEIVHVVRGITFPSSAKSKSPGTDRIACLRTTNVQDRLEWDDLLYIPTKYRKSDEQRLQRNDIVMSTANSRELVGKVALAEDERPDVTFGGFLAVIRPIRILPQYLMAVLRSPESRETLIGSSTQTTNIANISMGRLNPFVLCVPPLAEQRRIVAKVDELMALLDELERTRDDRDDRRAAFRDSALAALQNADDAEAAHAAWSRIATNLADCITDPADIAPLRKTILELAVRGRLVPQDPDDQPADFPRELTKVRDVNDRPPADSPDSWRWQPLGAVAELINGDRSKNYPKKSEYANTGIAWINTGHIEPDGTLDEGSMNYISKSKFESLRSGKIQPGDLVYCLRGATLGKTAIISQYEQGAIASSLVIIRLVDSIDTQFAYRVLTSPFGRKQIYRYDNGSAQPNLSAGSVKKYLFPIPPPAEQRRIVAKVDELMAICDELEQRLTEAKTHQSAFAAAAVHHLDLAQDIQPVRGVIDG